MNALIKLTLKSLFNRRLTVTLCLLSIMLSTTLFVGVEKLRNGAKEGFTNTISGADLLVGARSGPLQLLLYSVFHMGRPTNNMKYSSYQSIAEHHYTQWSIPLSLGDSYRGHRVVGTNENFFEHYRFGAEGKKITFRSGVQFKETYDVVIGAQVASKFNHSVGQKIVLSHGVAEESLYHHEDTPYQIVGVLAPTGTPLDRAVFITLEGMEAMHFGWESGVPDPENVSNKKLKRDEIEVEQITAMILKSRSRIFTLHQQRMIADFQQEPLMAVIPALALQDLWELMGAVESILFAISFCVLLVGLIGVFISLYTSLSSRRREIAILRSIGVGPFGIMFLLTFESLIMVLSGGLLGILSLYLAVNFLRPYLAEAFSLYVPVYRLESFEVQYIVLISIASLIIGIIPAYKAFKNSLQDGLAITS